MGNGPAEVLLQFAEDLDEGGECRNFNLMGMFGLGGMLFWARAFGP